MSKTLCILHPHRWSFLLVFMLALALAATQSACSGEPALLDGTPINADAAADDGNSLSGPVGTYSRTLGTTGCDLSLLVLKTDKKFHLEKRRCGCTGAQCIEKQDGTYLITQSGASRFIRTSAGGTTRDLEFQLAGSTQLKVRSAATEPWVTLTRVEPPWCALVADCGLQNATSPCGAWICAGNWCQTDCNCLATSPRNGATTVSVLPEAGEKPFVDLLQSAQSSIRVMIYLMGYGGILDALTAKAKSGVSVQVILDQGKVSTNQKYHDQLKAAGAQVLWSDPQFPYMHAKVIIVDGRQAMLSTGNFSKTYSIDLERNFAARVTDPEDVSDMVALFEADWKRAQPGLTCTRLLVSPVNARQRIIELIDSAVKTLTIESMQFADSDVRTHVAARKAKGVQVRAILAEASWISANQAAAALLKGQGIEVRSIPHCHTKSLVADGTRAYVGSENFSYTSLSKNREVGVVLTEAAAVKVIADTFETDWAAGTAF